MSSILRMPPLLPTTPQFRNLSSIGVLTDEISQLSIKPIIPIRRSNNSTIIRMGGGPRTFPGGVSKWQWKRMQAKKQKQLLKARLSRERQIYEMRKRAELRAAVSELERPWEVVERAPTLFSVSADDQLKALADRFHKPGGYDMWSQRDGPQLFHNPDGLPSARFLPKGAVHSVKPYGIRRDDDEEDEGEFYNGNKRRPIRNGGIGNRRRSRNESENVMGGGMNNLETSRDGEEKMSARGGLRGGLRSKGTRSNGDSRELDSKQFSYDTDKNQRGRSGVKVNRRDRGRPRVSKPKEVYDMSLKQDGSYGLQSNHQENMLLSGGLEDELYLI